MCMCVDDCVEQTQVHKIKQEAVLHRFEQGYCIQELRLEFTIKVFTEFMGFINCTEQSSSVKNLGTEN